MFAVEAIKKKVNEGRLKTAKKKFALSYQAQRDELLKGLKVCGERKVLLSREKERLKKVACETPSQRNIAEETLYLERIRDNERDFKRLTREWRELDRMHAQTIETLRSKDKLDLLRASDQIAAAIGKTTVRDKDLDDAANERDDALAAEDNLDEVRDMVKERAATPDGEREEEEEEKEKEKEMRKKQPSEFDGLAEVAFVAALHDVPLSAAGPPLTPAQRDLQKNEEMKKELQLLIQQLSLSTSSASSAVPKKIKKGNGKQKKKVQQQERKQD